MSTPSSGRAAPLLLLIDNYDSFTHNLAQYFWMLGQDVRVVRNDRISPREAADLRPDRVVVSPGPGGPADAGISVELIRRLAGRTPVLGVCLGHQCLAHAYGGAVVKADRVMHGKTSPVSHDGSGLHAGLPDHFPATRYHSLVVLEEAVPPRLRVTARAADDGAVMAIADEEALQYGVQYHPESYLTLFGIDVLRNFIEMTAGPRSADTDEDRVRGGTGGRRPRAAADGTSLSRVAVHPRCDPGRRGVPRC